MLSAQRAGQAAIRLEGMVMPVGLATGGVGPGRALAAELAALQPLLSVHAAGLPDATLALLDAAGQETGIRFAGVPAGQEFDVLLDDILAVSRGATALSPMARADLRDLPRPVDLKVYHTPACPRCAAAVRLAHQAALAAGGRLTVTAVDLTTFPEVAGELGITGVPVLSLDGGPPFAGSLPEAMLVQRIVLHAAGND